MINLLNQLLYDYFVGKKIKVTHTNGGTFINCKWVTNFTVTEGICTSIKINERDYEYTTYIITIDNNKVIEFYNDDDKIELINEKNSN